MLRNYSLMAAASFGLVFSLVLCWRWEKERQREGEPAVNPSLDRSIYLSCLYGYGF
jgi:hypothetical protein